MNYQLLDTPIGTLRLVAAGAQLLAIEFEGDYQPDVPDEPDVQSDNRASAAVLDACAAQLREYFAGQRREFDLPLAAQGTPFQCAVWSALSAIPHGELRSYRDIARAIGRPNAVRAVGAANGRNPLPIVVPCHRVIGSNGSLTGYAGGLDIKTQLLRLEGALPAQAV